MASQQHYINSFGRISVRIAAGQQLAHMMQLLIVLVKTNHVLCNGTDILKPYWARISSNTAVLSN